VVTHPRRCTLLALSLSIAAALAAGCGGAAADPVAGSQVRNSGEPAPATVATAAASAADTADAPVASGVEIVPLDPAAAAGVPVVGATGAEEAAARTALAAVAHDLPVESVVFDRTDARRRVVVVLRDGIEEPGEGASLHFWLANLVGRAITGRLAGSDHAIERIAVSPSRAEFGTVDDVQPARDPEAIGSVARAIADRAVAAGWEGATVRAWQLGPGAFAVDVPLTEGQFLQGRTDWQSTLIAD